MVVKCGTGAGYGADDADEDADDAGVDADVDDGEYDPKPPLTSVEYESRTGPSFRSVNRRCHLHRRPLGHRHPASQLNRQPNLPANEFCLPTFISSQISRSFSF